MYHRWVIKMSNFVLGKMLQQKYQGKEHYEGKAGQSSGEDL